MVGMALGGCSLGEVATKFGCHKSTISRILQKFNHTSNVQDKARSGRPEVLSLHQKKIIYRKARATPKIEY